MPTNASNAPVTLITGSSRGLGRDMALRLAEEGHDLIVTYRTRADEAGAVVAAIEARGRQAVALSLDAGDTNAIAGFVDRVRDALRTLGRDRLQALVHNGGSGLHKAFAEIEAGELDSLYAMHFKGPFLLTRALLPLIADGGRVLNVSSGLTRFTVPGYSAYAAMKGALEVLTRYQAKELGARDIAVNTLAPGAIATDFNGAPYATTRSSTPSSPRRPRSDGSVNPRISAVSPQRCFHRPAHGSTASASKPRVACFSKPVIAPHRATPCERCRVMLTHGENAGIAA